eukprot:TRINITY_DN5397_c0_g1_i2.p1 TRINITY_DN5397_c0_g1~~TRINITY_DN5397_c0_g1_i2.p1  ORF type:complete len:158 (+),score=25.79 TRINITY_DN5397_c0_g1_i2:245-718(+)
MVRFKNRYLLTELIWGDGLCDPSIKSSNISKLIRDNILKLFGEFGQASLQQAFQVKYFNASTGISIIRCARDGDRFRMAWAAMTMITQYYDGRPLMFRVIHVGGSIRVCQKAASKVGRERADLARAMREFATWLPSRVGGELDEEDDEDLVWEMKKD